MDWAGVGSLERFRAGRNRLRVRPMAGASGLAPQATAAPRASKTIGDRAALYAELSKRRRRAVIVARHALAIAPSIDDAPQRSGHACSNGSFHCAVNSSIAAEAAIGSTDASAA